VKEHGLENTKVVVSGEEATVTAGKKDRVQTAGRETSAVTRRQDRSRTAERGQRKPRTVALRAARVQGWAGETRQRVVQYQYSQPQPFWSPFPHQPSNYGYSWR